MEIKEEYVRNLLEKTEKALGSIELLDEKGEKVLDMAKRYVSDSRHFLEKGELVNALGAVEYAHGLLDSGVGLGFFKVNENQELFVFSENNL